MANSRKKVIVRTTDGTVLCGYAPQSGMVTEAGAAELLDLEGRILPIPLAEVRWIAFVRDFNLTDKAEPERLSRRTFLARPRSEGLWVRLKLAGGEMMEGLAPIDLSLLDGLIADGGLYLIPPDVRSNTQRLYIPRSVIVEAQLLAVITNPSKLKPVSSTKDVAQESLFPDLPDPPAR